MSRGGRELDSHLRDAQVEDVQFLIDEGGLQFDDACRRVGVSPDAVQQRVRRNNRAEVVA